MSEMRPVGWTARSQSGAFLALAAERHQVECHPQLYSSDEILPLYDGNTLATAIAEAVAAERERCAKVCEGLISEIFHERSSSPEPETGGVSVSSEDQEIITYLEEAVKAIRSAAK